MILVVNAGSSSLKVALYNRDLEKLTAGSITEIGSDGRFTLGDTGRDVAIPDHAAAVALVLSELDLAGYPLSGLTACGHRVVHGGAHMTTAARLTPEVIDIITDCIPLAPLHNPANLSAIHALGTLAPNLPQFASFDTSFHASNPPVATRYAIPQQLHDVGLRRYGFHGSSYAHIVGSFDSDLPPRLLAFHLGNGASLCAIKDGKSVATSMGYSPVSGLTMGTRSGDIDAAAVLRIASEADIAGADDLLNTQSGLTALAGDNDMRALLARNDTAAKFAVDHFCYWAARHAGSAIVAMGGIDAVAFTGGIGENAPQIRRTIMDHLSCFGDIPVHVIAADEERQIARDALGLLRATS
ncbi:acetate/propionate family kinase [Yoonia sp. MH D7]